GGADRVRSVRARRNDRTGDRGRAGSPHRHRRFASAPRQGAVPRRGGASAGAHGISGRASLMTRFDRLLDSDATDVERMLLDSASVDAPSARARRRALAAMGVSGAVLAGTPAAAAAKLAAAPGVKSVDSASGLLVLKWLGTGAVVGSVVAASIAT